MLLLCDREVPYPRRILTEVSDSCRMDSLDNVLYVSSPHDVHGIARSKIVFCTRNKFGLSIRYESFIITNKDCTFAA